MQRVGEDGQLLADEGPVLGRGRPGGRLPPGGLRRLLPGGSTPSIHRRAHRVDRGIDALGDLLQVEVPRQRGGCGPHDARHRLHQLHPLFDRSLRPTRLLQGAVEQELQSGLRRRDQLAERLHADAQHRLVRVLAAGRHQHPRRHRRRGRDLGGALRGAQAGRVAVENEDQLARAGTLHQIEVLLGQGGPAGRDRGLHACLVEPDGVEIAFHEQRHALAPDRVPRLVEREEHAALGLQRCIRRVEVLRLALALEQPPAEPDRPARLANGDRQPAPEAIVEALLLLARDAEPRFLYELRVHLAARHRFAQLVPLVRRVSQPPRLGGVHRDAALLQMVAGHPPARVLPQDPLVEDAGLFVHLGQRRPAGAAARLLRVLRLEVDARLAGELLGGLAEALAVELHDELDRVPGRAAAEAVEDPLVRHHVEAGRLLAVERAQPLPVAARLLEADPALHHRDHVDAVPQLLQLLVADARHSAPVKRPCRRRTHHEPLAASAAFTASLTRLPSALPCTLGMSAFITAPMSLGPLAPDAETASCTRDCSSASDSWRGRKASRMAISAFSLSASSGRPPALYWAAESRRCLMSVWVTATTSGSSSALPVSISRYLSALFSIRSVPRRRLSCARAASFISASIRSLSMPTLGRGPARLIRREGPVNSEPGKRLHHPLPCLLQGALLGRQRLLLALDRRLLIVLALPDLAQDACLLALLLEALHGVLERLAFLDAHVRHSRNHHPSRGTRVPLLLRAREYTRGPRSVNPTRGGAGMPAGNPRWRWKSQRKLRGARLRLRRDGDRLGGLAGAVHPVAQLLAGPEEDAALGLDRDHLSGLGVAPVVALVVLHVEGAKAADLDVVALAERLLHRVEDRLDGQLSLLLGELSLGHEDGDEVALQHGRFSDSGRAGAPKTNDEWERYPRSWGPGKRRKGRSAGDN